MLHIVRGDDAASVSSAPSAGATMTRELFNLTRDYVDIIKGGDGSCARGPGSRCSPPSPAGMSSASESMRGEAGGDMAARRRAAREPSRLDSEARAPSGDGIRGGMLATVRSDGQRAPDNRAEQPSRYLLRSRPASSNASDNRQGPDGSFEAGKRDQSAEAHGDARWWRPSRLVQPIIRALDRKFVVVDVVTIHRVQVHVERVLRVLQGDAMSPNVGSLPPRLSGVPCSETNSDGPEGAARQRLPFTCDADFEAGASENHAVQSHDGAKGDHAQFGIAGKGMRRRGGEKEHDRGGSAENALTVKPLFVEAIRMNADDFRPDPLSNSSQAAVPLGIPPSDAVR